MTCTSRHSFAHYILLTFGTIGNYVEVQFSCMVALPLEKIPKFRKFAGNSDTNHSCVLNKATL